MPAGAAGTMNLIGFEGYSSAWTAKAETSNIVAMPLNVRPKSMRSSPMNAA